MVSQALRDTTLIGVVPLLDGLMETGWVAGAIIQASELDHGEGRAGQEEGSGSMASGVIQTFQTWRPGKLRLLL